MKDRITLDELKAYRNLRDGCLRAKRQIQKLADSTARTAALLAAEKRKKFPHLHNLMTEEGLALNERKIEDKKLQLKEDEQRLKDMLAGISAFLKTVVDQQIRETIELYYLDGMNYLQVAECMGDPGDGTTQMKRVRRFMDRLAEMTNPDLPDGDREAT